MSNYYQQSPSGARPPAAGFSPEGFYEAYSPTAPPQSHGHRSQYAPYHHQPPQDQFYSPPSGYSLLDVDYYPPTYNHGYSLLDVDYYPPTHNHGRSLLDVDYGQPPHNHGYSTPNALYRPPQECCYPPDHGPGFLTPSSEQHDFNFKEDSTYLSNKDLIRTGVFSLINQLVDNKSSIRNQNDVGVKLAKPIMVEKMNGNANCVFSPLSINIVLSFIAEGATGSTKEQLLSFLKSSSIEESIYLASELVNNVLVDGSSVGGPRLSFVNGAWIDQSLSFKPDFKDVADHVYKARTTQVDFQNKADEARIEVNNWAENETNGLIKDLIPDGAVKKTTKLILANALYFKGVWDQKFKESMTGVHDFHLLNGSTIKAPLMTSREDQYISVYEGFKVLRLPYQQGRNETRCFSLYLYLPDKIDGLPILLEKISRQPGFIESHLPRHSRVPVGNFFIPKFEILYEMEASDILKQLGLILPFEEEGLTDMVNTEICISRIFHKSFIEINERGTEAAAATAAVIAYEFCLGPREPKPVVDFVADHPFLFLIREDCSGAVLFMGSVVNPVCP